jgi:hypothetical protein
VSEFDLRVLSLGAGVQSSTMYCMAALGEITPMPDVAIFADVGAEPPWVYEHLKWLRDRYGHIIPIEVVSTGNLADDWFSGALSKLPDGGTIMPAAIPFHTRNADGSKGMLQRQCTKRYKLEPIYKKVRDLLGLKKGERVKDRYQVEMWVGISLDEVQRMKPAPESWVTKRYPLIMDVEMRRGDCLRWMEAHRFPLPNRSACWMCPFRSDSEWLDLKAHPEIWEKVVAYDAKLRTQKPYGRAGERLTSKPYLHATLVPIGEVVFKHENQPDLFGNECEGMCGV